MFKSSHVAYLQLNMACAGILPNKRKFSIIDLFVLFEFYIFKVCLNLVIYYQKTN